MTLATTRGEVADRVLGPVAAMVGAGAAAVLMHGSCASRGLTTRRARGWRRWSLAAGEPEVLAVDAPGATFLI